jgi:hypothetical protein
MYWAAVNGWSYPWCKFIARVVDSPRGIGLPAMGVVSTLALFSFPETRLG